MISRHPNRDLSRTVGLIVVWLKCISDSNESKSTECVQINITKFDIWKRIVVINPYNLGPMRPLEITGFDSSTGPTIRIAHFLIPSWTAFTTIFSQRTGHQPPLPIWFINTSPIMRTICYNLFQRNTTRRDYYVWHLTLENRRTLWRCVIYSCKASPDVIVG